MDSFFFLFFVFSIVVDCRIVGPPSPGDHKSLPFIVCLRFSDIFYPLRCSFVFFLFFFNVFIVERVRMLDEVNHPAGESSSI